jgi:DNA-binding GntR family transcriptional regulator
MADESMRIASVSAPIRFEVTRLLREAILSSRFKQGQRLIERDLCELFGVSRPPVREALRELEVEGLIENVPNRGPEVARLKKSDAESIYQVRGQLEALAAKLFVRRASDEHVARLETALANLAKAYKDGDVEANIKAKAEFYGVLFEGSGNEIIPNILRTMNARINLLRRVSLASPSRLPESLKEMQSIVSAIKARDENAAFAACLVHVEKSAEVALASLPD